VAVTTTSGTFSLTFVFAEETSHCMNCGFNYPTLKDHFRANGELDHVFVPILQVSYYIADANWDQSNARPCVAFNEQKEQL